MPSSASDRFTVDFEYLFFFTKNKKYYFEQQLEDSKCEWNSSDGFNEEGQSKRNIEGRIGKRDDKVQTGRNKRCVWQINTKPFKEAHFAVYPQELIRTPINACCPKGGVVLDPFMGSGTTAIEAITQKKDYVGIELNDEYIKIAQKRIEYTQDIMHNTAEPMF